MAVTTVTSTGAGSVTIPAGISSVKVEAWGAGGGAINSGTTNEPGGGGGAYISANITVTPGDIIYYSVGNGATAAQGQPSWFQKNVNSQTNSWFANGGQSGSGRLGGTPTEGTVGTLIAKFNGGDGALPQGGGGSRGGSGGGGSAGPDGNGLGGSAGSGSSGGQGGGGDNGAGGSGGLTTGASGDANVLGGGGGAGGVGGGGTGGLGGAPGGGAGGAGSSSTATSAGARGQIRYSWFIPTVQRAFRFYNDGTEAGAVAIAAENINITRPTGVQPFILRISVQEAGDSAIGTSTWQLQYSKNGGAYANVTAISGNVQAYNSPSLSDNANTTQRLSSGTGTFEAGKTDSASGNVSDSLAQNNFTEHALAIQILATSAEGDTFDFRLINTAVGQWTYSQVGRVTIQNPTGDAITINSYSTGSPDLGAPTLSQKHSVNINSYSTGSPTSPLQIAGQHALAINSYSVGSPTLGSPTIQLKIPINIPTYSVGSPTLGAPAITQKHTMSIAAFAPAAPSLGAMALQVKHTLQIASYSVGALGLAAPTVTQKHNLSISSYSTGSPTFGNVGFSSASNTVAINIGNYNVGAPTLGAPTLQIKHALTINSFSAGSPTSPMTVKQNHQLAISSYSTGAPSAIQPTIQQKHNLSIASFFVGSPTFGSPAIQQTVGIVIPSFSTASPTWEGFAVQQEWASNVTPTLARTLSADWELRVLNYENERFTGAYAVLNADYENRVLSAGLEVRSLS